MTLYVTDLRKQLFDVLKMVDEGREITIIKKDTGKKYKIVPVEEKESRDIVKIAREMGEIGLKWTSPEEIKRIIETKYDD